MSTAKRAAAAAYAAGAVLLAGARAAEAQVEVTSALSIGGGARFPFAAAPAPEPAPAPVQGLFTLALRADVLFGRAGPRHFAAGPFLSLRTDNFRDFAPALGASLLVPVTESFPLVLSAGGVLRVGAEGVSGGALERVWFGARSFNYHSAYALAIGLFVESRQLHGAGGAVDVVGGLDLDLEVFAIPFIGLYSLMFRRGR